MRNANLPAGPANPKTTRADAATEQEELDELRGDAAGGNTSLPQSADKDARHAERNAHVGARNANATGVGRQR
ncbi:MAG: hypothetical protein JF586_03300 [Burkholderiales bacterium]|jgi:hypothetical protein|nr:hypothetical protein [Burkholderiales bacterium]